MSLTLSDAQKTLTDVISIAQTAGAQTRDLFNQSNGMELKSSGVDLVTTADRQTEEFITQTLVERYPDFNVVGEEGHGQTTASSYRWFVDPIDGTTNFAHGIPHFAICIALFDSDSFPPLLGVTYDPMRDETFAALRDNGATLNGKPMRVTQTPKLAQSVVASGFPYSKWDDPDNNAEQWGNFVVRSRGVRRMGSAGLDVAYVAAGRYDGYWEHNLSAWDVSSSMICLHEAGGTFSDYAGNPLAFQMAKLRMVATNGKIHAEMVDVLQRGEKAPRPKSD